MNAWDALSAKHIPTFASVADDIVSLRGDLEKELTSGPLAKSLTKAFEPVYSRLAGIEASLRALEQREAGFFPPAAGRGTAPKPSQRPMLRIVK
jgi:hypothetical protein